MGLSSNRSAPTQVYLKHSWIPIQLQWVTLKIRAIWAKQVFMDEPEHTATTCNTTCFYELSYIYMKPSSYMKKIWHGKEIHRDPNHSPIPTITKEGEKRLKVTFFLAGWTNLQTLGEAKDVHICQPGKLCNSPLVRTLKIRVSAIQTPQVACQGQSLRTAPLTSASNRQLIVIEGKDK